jgi:hypothetical protein
LDLLLCHDMQLPDGFQHVSVKVFFFQKKEEKNSKHTVSLDSKYTRALTFENVCVFSPSWVFI